MTVPRLTGNRCLCRGCGQLFNSAKPFDRHRIGGPLGRRCLTPVEMHGRGMSLNQQGFWRTEPRPKARLGAVAKQIPAELRCAPMTTHRGDRAGRQFGTEANPEHQSGGL